MNFIDFYKFEPSILRDNSYYPIKLNITSLSFLIIPL